MDPPKALLPSTKAAIAFTSCWLPVTTEAAVPLDPVDPLVPEPLLATPVADGFQPRTSMISMSVCERPKVSPGLPVPKTSIWVKSAVSQPFTRVVPLYWLLNDCDESVLPPSNEKYVVLPSRPSVTSRAPGPA